MKVLFASDGSECSGRAAQYLVKSLRAQVKDLKVTLFYVDIPMLDRVVNFALPRFTGKIATST